ncbi:MAG: inositol monophosphatase family protein [Acidimicrobiales bacterium]
MPDPIALRDLASAVAVDAGRLLLDVLVGSDLSIETKSSPTDMVTEMDRSVERLLVAGILAARPDDSIMGEEGADQIGTSGVRWLLDPIDGTTNFVYGIPGFNVSVAAEVDGQVVAGAVLDPLHDDLFTAAAGEGAQRNGRCIRCNPSTGLAHALVATGFSYDRTRREGQARVLTTVLPAVRDIRRIGAAALDLCWVACGRVDAYYEQGLAPWDYAAGSLVAQEAGAIVGDLRGGAPSPTFTLAGGSALFGPLRDLLRRADADA